MLTADFPTSESFISYLILGDSLTCVMDNSVTLESELQRVQKKVGDLQKQRQELSIQVKQLTDRSSNLTSQKVSILAQHNQCKFIIVVNDKVYGSKKGSRF